MIERVKAMKQHELHLFFLIIVIFGIIFSMPACMKPKFKRFPELEIEPEQLQWRIQNDFDFELIDVRSYEDFEKGHLPGAKHFPAEDIYQNLELIPKDKLVILYCGTGNQSLLTARMLSEHNYNNVKILKGGMKAWTYEIEKKSNE